MDSSQADTGENSSGPPLGMSAPLWGCACIGCATRGYFTHTQIARPFKRSRKLQVHVFFHCLQFVNRYFFRWSCLPFRSLRVQHVA
jgi:hypothetical protein